MAKSGRGLPRNLRRVSRDRVDALIVEREGMFRGYAEQARSAGPHGQAEAERLRAEAMAGAQETTATDDNSSSRRVES